MKALLHRSCSVALLLLVLVAIPAVFLVEAAADDPSSTLGSSDTGTHPSQYSTDDELSVTSGRCAPASATEGDIGPCTSGSVLTLTGTGLTSATTVVIGRTTDQQSKIQCGSPTANDQGTQLTCTLTIDNSIADGEYPIAVGSSGTTGGNVMTGTFLQQTIAGWDNHELTAAQYLVAGVSDLWPSTGDEWTVYGNFDTSKAYKVLFYNTEEGVAAKNNGKTPTCTSPTLTSNSLQCTITVEPSVMGMWGILVQEESSGAYLPVPKSLKGAIAVNPPLPTVTSATGDCADDSSKCVSGAELTLVGTNFNQQAPEYNSITVGDDTETNAAIKCTEPAFTAEGVTCKLALTDSAVNGIYPIYVSVQVCEKVMPSPKVRVGTLVLGTYLQQTVAGWAAAPSSSSLQVVGVSGLHPSTGDKWTVYGNFDTSKAYKVLFYNTEEGVAANNNGKTPTCASPTLTSNSLQCTITVEPSVMGMWGILVQEESSGAYLPVPKSLNGTIAVNPTLPTVTSATGDCADDSSKCVSGAELTLVGTNFNQQAAKYNNIIIGASSGSSFTCTPKEVTATSLTCTLDVAAGAVAGSYDIAVEVHVCSMGMPSPAASAGTFVYGEKSGTPGWSSHNNGGAGTCEPTSCPECDQKGGGGGNNPAAIAFAVIFALAFTAFLIVVIVLCCRYDFVRKGTGGGMNHYGDGADGYWNADRVMHPMPTTTLDSGVDPNVRVDASKAATERYRV